MKRRLAINWGGKGWSQPDAAPKRKRTVQMAPERPAPPADVVEAALAELGAPAGQRIICDYPPNALNPNKGVHWSRRAKARRRYRSDCHALALASKTVAPKAGVIRVRLDMFPPRPDRRDDDNAISAFKAGRDGIAEALKVDDSRFKIEPHLHSRPLGCIVFTILEEAPDAR